jgi:hypothetical protein
MLGAVVTGMHDTTPDAQSPTVNHHPTLTDAARPGLDTVIAAWLLRHRDALRAAVVRGNALGRGRVGSFLEVAHASPVEGLTPETLAAAAVTEAYLQDPVQMAELMGILQRAEEAKARAYARRPLLELLQNAEDAKDAGDTRSQHASGAEVRIAADSQDDGVWIDVSYDGRPFDAADVDAFRAMHSSTKRGDASTIGEYGVGIKGLVSCADVVELHSGGFHLRFTEGEPGEPFFLLPRATAPRPSAHSVHLRFRWRSKVSPETALTELLGDFGPEHLLFLSKVRSLRLPDRVIGLERRPARGRFQVFGVIGQPSEERWVIGSPDSAAVAVRVERTGNEVRVLPSARPPAMAAFFPIFKQSANVGAWLHARLPLSDDRESLSLASPEDRRAVGRRLAQLAALLADVPGALADTGCRVDRVAETILGGAAALTATLRTPPHADDEVALNQGVAPTDLLKHKTVRALAAKAWVPSRDGRSVRLAQSVWFGGGHHDLWEPAVGRRAELPPPEMAAWLAAAPRSALGIPTAGWVQFEQAMAGRCGVAHGQRLCEDLAGPQTGAATARLALSLAPVADYRAPTRLPVVLAGKSSGEILVDLSARGSSSADVAALGLCTLDDTAYAELTPAEKSTFEAFLRTLGAIPTRAGGLLSAVTRRTADTEDTGCLAAGLRVAMRALRLCSRPIPSAAEVCKSLFGAAEPHALDTESDVYISVALARVRVPMRDGTWRPLGHGTVFDLDGVPPSARIDVAEVARLLHVSVDQATSELLTANASRGVPIQTWFALPLGGKDGVDEHARFVRDAPGGLEALYNRFRAGLPGAGRGRAWPDLPGAESRASTGGEIPAAGGFAQGAPGALRVLAQADVPEGTAAEAIRGLAGTRDWLPFASVPVWHDAAGRKNRANAVSPAGWFPSRLALRLRASLALPLLPSPATRPGPGLFRVSDYPRTPTPRSGLTRLPLIHTDIADAWPADVLDALHLVSLDTTDDPRHVLRALVYLRQTMPASPVNADAPEAAPLLAAHRDLWQWLVAALKRRGGSLDDLTAACVDAARLGWIPPEMADPAQLPMLVDRQTALEWRTVGTCRDANAERCAFYDTAGGAAGWRLSRGLAFVALRRDNEALAKLLDIPVFGLAEPEFETQDLQATARDWIAELIVGLTHPFLRHVLTEHGAGGGVPMSVERFEERAADAGLHAPRVLGVQAWPTHAVVTDPPGGRIRIDQPAYAKFRFARQIEHGGRRTPTFLVDATLAADRLALEAARWRLDVPLAEALGSRAHAPMIQNLLHHLNPTNVGHLKDDPGLVAVLGRELVDASDPKVTAAPNHTEDAAGLLDRVFRRVRVRAAAVVLCHGDSEATLVDDADRRWPQTTTLYRLRNAARQAPNLAAVLATVLGVEVPADATFERMGDAIIAAADAYDLDVVEARLTTAMRGRHWHGMAYDTPEALDAQLAAEAEVLPLAAAATGYAVPAGPPTGRRGFGRGSRFSSRAHPIGRLGEHLAQRWAVHYLAGGDASRVVDVSTPAARESARSTGRLPSTYPAGPDDVSPGVDLLVFIDGPDALPLGLEVKSRAGDGNIAFEWTRNESERCQRTLEGRAEDWPLSDYRALVVSNLDTPPSPPSFVMLDATTLTQAADPTRFTVRAKKSND